MGLGLNLEAQGVGVYGSLKDYLLNVAGLLATLL